MSSGQRIWGHAKLVLEYMYVDIILMICFSGQLHVQSSPNSEKKEEIINMLG